MCIHPLCLQHDDITGHRRTPVFNVLCHFSAVLSLLGLQERALEATRDRLRSELGELALKRSTLINCNFREMPAELEPQSVQLVV